MIHSLIKMNTEFLTVSMLATEVTSINTVWSCFSKISWAIEERPVHRKSGFVVMSSIFSWAKSSGIQKERKISAGWKCLPKVRIWARYWRTSRSSSGEWPWGVLCQWAQGVQSYGGVAAPGKFKGSLPLYTIGTWSISTERFRKVWWTIFLKNLYIKLRYWRVQ
jgi:hypothetical protein